VRHEVLADALVVDLPRGMCEPVRSGRYLASVPANARLAGLVRGGRAADPRCLVPFVFAEVRLPDGGRAGHTPRLSSRLPSSRWVFCWDARRRCGYLLATPRPADGRRLRFQVEWLTGEVAANRTKE
jgi:hypothetical protein